MGSLKAHIRGLYAPEPVDYNAISIDGRPEFDAPGEDVAKMPHRTDTPPTRRSSDRSTPDSADDEKEDNGDTSKEERQASTCVLVIILVIFCSVSAVVLFCYGCSPIPNRRQDGMDHRRPRYDIEAPRPRPKAVRPPKKRFKRAPFDHPLDRFRQQLEKGRKYKEKNREQNRG